MEAFAPGSVTAIFAPADSGDESKGASLAIEDGVIADVTPADETGLAASADAPVVTVDGEPTAFEPVEIALETLGVAQRARADLTAEIPIGRGFGASGAATLTTALAADAEFGLDYSRDELVGVAHRAEVAAGTGLGDVFVQDLGGLVVGDGTQRRRFAKTTPVEYDSFGPIPTEEALADEGLMARIERAGTAALESLPDDPALAELTDAAWAFAEATELPTPQVRAAVADVRTAGGAASMAMVGETVFAVGVENALPNRTAVCPEGARLR
ncbi:GHMP kinase [Halobacteriales archaeon QS_1_67_19]|nr:MAG: GHMP kinase [Halobacteriales archaeon QS_1_67_19]